MKNRIEVKIGGFGGQGVILAGQIVGKAASLFDGKHAAFTQSFGPEARGSACSSQVIVSAERILYPYVKFPDILVVMSQEAFVKFSPALKPDGMLIYEKSLVTPVDLPASVRTAGIPSTQLAEELGRRITSNIVMTGFFAAVTGIVSEEATRKAVMDSVPKGTEKLNLEAFEKGFAYGRAHAAPAAAGAAQRGH
ncbi:MAG: pyruvate ferredoxin oxidoreductase [Elusimicrobia bacterium GWA2_69_24]|nr:MAG: pyruvate ferredoxin oxidoreductase [Elusimicrobia bacterium GWA2_69_24]HBL16867.1 pyruvate ferredoxin oxidoreductase [Elusimicrobiota bacterium]